MVEFRKFDLRQELRTLVRSVQISFYYTRAISLKKCECADDRGYEAEIDSTHSAHKIVLAINISKKARKFLYFSSYKMRNMWNQNTHK